jgi:hypothetical protein
MRIDHLAPATVLLELRQHGESSFADLRNRLGIHESPSDARSGRLAEILRALEEVGIVTATAHADADGLGPDAEGRGFRERARSREQRLSFWCAPDRRYRVSSRLAELQVALGFSLNRLSEERNGRHDAERRDLDDLARTIDARMPACGYKTDLVRSITELSVCIGAGAYIACLGLAGKLLEVGLKDHFEATGTPFSDDWPLGPLLGKLGESGAYADPALKNIANIINASRIPAVHAKREVPVPSADQAVMVVRAVLDVLKRLVVTRLA